MAINPLTGLPYNNSAYVPGGASNRVARAIQNKGYAPGAYSPGGGVGGPPDLGPIQISQTPDYAGLIKADPLFSQLRMDLSAEGVSDAASRAAATRRALIALGQVPQFDQLAGLNPEWLNADIDEPTRLAAQRATESGMSITARQTKAFKDQVRAIKNALAARGALRSGEAGYQLQEAQLRRDQAQYDTTREIAEFIAGLQAGFAEKERQRLAQQRGGAAEAQQRVQQQYPDPGPITADPISGSGVWRSADGRLWNPDGTPYVEPGDSYGNASLDPNTRARGPRGLFAL